MNNDLVKTANPFDVIAPKDRWVPNPTQKELDFGDFSKLMPPLVAKIREAVHVWRESNYVGVSDTTKALLTFWFKHPHPNNFSFFFSQREAIETIAYLFEVKNAYEKYDLMRFDGSGGRLSTGMFPEDWTRYVIKMATGAGKTKVMALTLVWSYFHKLYESNSRLSRNFLIIAPNIIVLERLRKDLEELKMLFQEPFIPLDGFEDRDWYTDFQFTYHYQDELKTLAEHGNIFLTNIHRVFLNEDKMVSEPETIYLGVKPKADADTSKGLDLGKILRGNKIKDLVILNDEAHHIHDPSLAWFKSIQDINNKLKLENGIGLSLQADYTATPKSSSGGIFPQTISDYPLVEAIKHGVVKKPVLPDDESRKKLIEKPSDDFIEMYKDFLDLGYTEWEKQFDALFPHKTPVLFVMSADTKDANKIADYLNTLPKLKDKVLTIHTKPNGELSEGVSKKDKDELKKLRDAANDIDSDASPYRAVVSVLMLREGWDVKNVTTIVGLRMFTTDNKILPEQAIGRGLRKMFPLDQEEKLVVIGTPKFMAFVEELKTEGVSFEYSAMGTNTAGKSPIVVEIDKENPQKDLDVLDILTPIVTPRFVREFKNLDQLDPLSISAFEKGKYIINIQSESVREIVFVDIDGKESHRTVFNNQMPNYRNVIGFLTQLMLSESRLNQGFDLLYPKVESFIENRFFGKIVPLDDVTAWNIIKIENQQALQKIFKKAIDDLTVIERNNVALRSTDFRSLKSVTPKIVPNQPHFESPLSIFNIIIGDSAFERTFAKKLNTSSQIKAFAKNTFGANGVNFQIEYQAENGNISTYFPDFLVKKNDKEIFIIETKGREDLDDVRKVKRLAQWCKDVNALQNQFVYKTLYIKQEEWDSYQNQIRDFMDMENLFLFV
jgi:type III restriction enzyme